MKSSSRSSRGRYGEAKPFLQQALTIRLEQLGENQPDVTTSYNDLGALYYAMGRYREAMPCFLQALEIAQLTLGENHLNTRTFYNNCLTMLFQAPVEEILKILPPEGHQQYLQAREQWHNQDTD